MNKTYKDTATGEVSYGDENKVEEKKGKVLVNRVREIDLLRASFEILDGLGYSLIPDQGPFNGFSVYKLESYSLPIAGLIPHTIKKYRLLNRSDTNDNLKITEMSRLVDEDSLLSYFEGSDKLISQVRKFLNKFDNSMFGGPNNIMRDYSSYLYDMGSDLTYSSSGSPAHKLVPQRSWFSQKFQDKVDTDKLLALLPEPERKTLMLCLGRVIAGPDGTTTVEGHTINHTFRSMAIMVGHEAGIGKSSLFGRLGILECLELLGYKVAVSPPILNRFSYHDLATSDITWVDDLTDKSLCDILRDPNIKSVVSGGKISCEKKYQDAIPAVGRSVFIGACNNFPSSIYLDMDEGSINRTNPLLVKTEWELTKDEDLTPVSYWGSLAKELQADTKSLAMYLLLESYELFMRAAGYDPCDLSKGKGDDVLKELCGKLRSNYKIDCNLKHVDELVNNVVKSLAIVAHKDNTLVSKIKSLPLSYELLLPIIKYLLKTHKAQDSYFERYYISWASSYDDLFKKFVKMNYRDNKLGTDNPNRLFEDIVSSLSTNSGYGLPRKKSAYNSYWQRAMRDLEKFMETWDKAPFSNPETDELIASLEQIVSLA